MGRGFGRMQKAIMNALKDGPKCTNDIKRAVAPGAEWESAYQLGICYWPKNFENSFYRALAGLVKKGVIVVTGNRETMFGREVSLSVEFREHHT